MQNPCLTCARLRLDKNGKRCKRCTARLEYLQDFEDAPPCLEDPAYELAYRTPRGLKLLRSYEQISDWDLL